MIRVDHAGEYGATRIYAGQLAVLRRNGTEAKLQVFNENYYEAKHNHTTISLTINPDGTPDVSYTGQHGAKDFCCAL